MYLPLAVRVLLFAWPLVALSGGVLTGRAADPAPTTVSLSVDYGDGVVKQFPRLPWAEKLTALGALELAAKHPRGVKIAHRGAGETAFVTKIDDLANEREGKAWIYSVNGKSGDRSAGVCVLAAGDAVLWKFDVYR